MNTHLSFSPCVSSFISFSTAFTASRFFSTSFRFSKGVLIASDMYERRIAVLADLWAFPGVRPLRDAAIGMAMGVEEGEADGILVSIMYEYEVLRIMDASRKVERREDSF